MQPHTHWVKRDAIEATVAKYLLENEGLRFIGALLKYLEGKIQMNNKDKTTVETFVSTGMDLETLYTCFPDFSREEIAEIYKSCKDNQFSDGDEHKMSINCS